MRKSVGLLTAAIALAAASVAYAAPVTADISPDVVSADAFPAKTAAYPGGVTGYADVVYARMQGFRPLTLDLFAPTQKGPPRPLVIYVHGGGWTGGTSRNAAAFRNFPAVLADLASRGYVVASLNYRLAGEARFPAAADDVDAAIKWLKANAGQYGIDKTRVGIWGGSAGGQLAGLAATDCAKAQTGDDDCVQSAVIWYGVFDFATLGGPAPAAGAGPRPPGGPASYLGCDPRQCADVAAKASPVTFVDARDPPFLLIHGTDDKTVPYPQSEEMLTRLKAAGVKASLLTLPGYDHSFIGKSPELTREGHLKALQATFDFFDATLKK